MVKKKIEVSANCFKPNPDFKKKHYKKKETVDHEGSHEDSHDEGEDEYFIDSKNEQLVLGQCLSNQECFKAFVDKIHYDDFLISNHKVIAFCILKAYEDSVQITDDIFDVYRYDYPDDERDYGGLKYIVKLKKHYQHDLDKQSYQIYLNKLKKDKIKNKIGFEKLITIKKLVNDPSSTLEEIKHVIDETEGLLSNVNLDNRRGFQTMEQVNESHDKEIERREDSDSKLTTGFSFLNGFISKPFARGHITVYAGRPAMGKSAFVANTMIRLSCNRLQPIPTALFALEMNAVSTIDRMNAIQSGVPLSNLIMRGDSLTESGRELEKKVKNKRKGKPLYINDDVRMNLSDIKREIKRLRDEKGVYIFFIDLFMKVQKPTGMRNKTTADEYTAMLNEIQIVARELDVHIGLVVQIGRKAEMRADKRPMMSDLKESGAYEEVADLIVMFYRDSYYVNKDLGHDLEVDIMEVIIGKQRDGGVGTAKCLFDGKTTKISNASEDDLKLFDEIMAEMKAEKKEEKQKKSKKSYSNW